jgi:heparosan-N-sulfate-glucuronate 5-epimerase
MISIFLCISSSTFIITIISIFNFPIYAQIIYDNHGLPFVDYGDMMGVHIGMHYNPITIAQKSDKYYEDFITTHNETSKMRFLSHANWFVDNALTIGNYSFFVYNFPFPPYQLESPWFSAMAQAESLPRLLKAYDITDDKIYLQTAKKALNVLFININDPCKCGVTYKTSDRGWWFEEYANGHSDGPRVLNGMMFTLVDIYDYYNATNNNAALYLFDQGLTSLKAELHNYDKNGTYSSYDKIKGYAPIEYHLVHVCLLEKLYRITNDQFFNEYYTMWSQNTDGLSVNEHC